MSHLPRDPATGKIRGGPGRPRGLPDVRVRLAKDQVSEAFTRLGGVDELVRWCQASERNRRVFYGAIWTRLLPAEAAEAIAKRLSETMATRPVIREIRNVVVAVDGSTAEIGVAGFQPYRPPALDHEVVNAEVAETFANVPDASEPEVVESASFDAEPACTDPEPAYTDPEPACTASGSVRLEALAQPPADAPPPTQPPPALGASPSVAELRAVMASITRIQDEVSAGRKQLSQSQALLVQSEARLRQAEERQERDRREAQARREAETLGQLAALSGNDWY